MTRKPAPISIDSFLAAYPPAIQALARELMTLVREVAEEVDERVYPGWKLIGYRKRGYFCCVAPQDGRVRVGFEHGAGLPDPDGILEGDGQMRWISVTGAAKLPRRALRTMIELAVQDDEARAGAAPKPKAKPVAKPATAKRGATKPKTKVVAKPAARSAS